MLFNSYLFIFGFLPITLLVFFLLARLNLHRQGIAFLVVASLFFYAYWDIKYLSLLILSIMFNYAVGRSIEQSKDSKKMWLAFGIIIDLTLLGYFKYTRFLFDSINDIFNTSLALPKIVLPLGISFFTFTQIAYLVDTFRGETKRNNLSTYALFVTFFPHLIAGPILDPKKIIPQFFDWKNFTFSHKNFSTGVTLFILGLSKKVLVADTIAGWVIPVFDNAAQSTFLTAWTGALGYTFQLYFDFSGYSDMAVGLGLMLNIKLPKNFDSPYKSASIIEFWRRWHITLSNFLRDYLYIPLGGNRQGYIRKMFNLFITMLLGGLWHGAGWTFVIWGALHGFYLIVNHTWQKINRPLPKNISWFLTFLSVVIAWVFFRANSVFDAVLILKSMFGLNGVTVNDMDFGLISSGLALIFAVRYLPNTSNLLNCFRPNIAWLLALYTLAVLSLLNLNRVSEFLYFQF